ncbi:MAG: lytic transglycosylase domain-containing protein [Pseudomonadota bacterium]|nr:lytic transglycosylase domain-containing protein [Pseudomonadota bacterium]
MVPVLRVWRILLVCLVVVAPLALPGPARAADVPRILSFNDAATYARIFRAQRSGDWKTADAAIVTLRDDLLIGHVLYQRYMHPTGWRSSYGELHAWMRDHADLPRASNVYALAQRRRPTSGWKALAPPRRQALRLPQAPGEAPSGSAQTASGRTAPAPHNPAERAMLRRIWLLPPDPATTLLTSREARGLRAAARSEAWSGIARSWLSRGRTVEAAEAGRAAAQGAGPGRQTGAFIAGVADWANGDIEDAFDMFSIAAEDEVGTEGLMNGAPGLWLARAALATGRYGAVLPALRQAGRDPRSLYGQLALRMLARQSGFTWRPPEIDGATWQRLLAEPGIRRALALAEAGQIDRADMELRQLAQGADAGGMDALLAVAATIDAPATAYRIARMRGEAAPDAALFPAPDWPFRGDLGVDRALVYAVARKESGFDPLAESPAGARGVMQLMPATARYMARESGIDAPHSATLYDTAMSVRLGQAYLRHMLEDARPRNSLLHAIASYNGGPGNVRTWSRRLEGRDDPLLFLEMIGSAETRHFTREVLASYWIYRHRLGQPAPSLDALARGLWPVYIALD